MATRKKIQTPMKEKIQNAYMDYVLTHGNNPHSVYIFSKSLELTEVEFYEHFNSFPAIESSIWADMVHKTIVSIENQEVWKGYSIREKFLSFFYSFCELLKANRSYVTYSFKPYPQIKEVALFSPLKKSFLDFSDKLIKEGLDSKEIMERKYLSDRYRDGFWVQFIFIINFWIHDNSPGFEKTDEAIEKGINLSMDLMTRSPLDAALDYGKFLFRNRRHAFSTHGN